MVDLQQAVNTLLERKVAIAGPESNGFFADDDMRMLVSGMDVSPEDLMEMGLHIGGFHMEHIQAGMVSPLAAMVSLWADGYMTGRVHAKLIETEELRERHNKD